MANKSRCDSQHQRCSMYTSRAGDSNLLGLIPSDVPRRRRGAKKKTQNLSNPVCVWGLLLYRVLHCGLILYDNKVATNTPGFYFKNKKKRHSCEKSSNLESHSGLVLFKPFFMLDPFFFPMPMIPGLGGCYIFLIVNSKCRQCAALAAA